MNRAAVGSVVIESGCVFGGGAVINRRWWLLILLLIGGALGVRLAWTVAVSELGWRPLRDQWTIVARSLIGLDNTPLKDRDPAQQAEFWLSEVARVTAAGDDPQAAMGAAWMLDAPQFGFIQHHIRMKDGPDVPGLPASWRRELDHQAIDALVDEFETRCREECLARIETAVRLDESDVELQRSRALLLFQAGFMSLRSEPRRADWLDVLDECAVRDPENALYDYLAVVPLWTSAAHYDYDAEVDGYVLTITDEEMFRQGDARFAAGLARPHLKFGMQVHAATFAFLDESSVLRAEHVEAAGSRLIDSRVTQLLYLVLMRWQHVRKDVAARAGRIEEAAGAVRSVLRIADQLPRAETPPLLRFQADAAELGPGDPPAPAGGPSRRVERRGS